LVELKKSLVHKIVHCKNIIITPLLPTMYGYIFINHVCKPFGCMDIFEVVLLVRQLDVFKKNQKIHPTGIRA